MVLLMDPDVTRLLAAEGVARIIVITEETERYRRVRLAPGTEVWHRDRLAEAQRVLAATEGVTILIHDQACAAESRRKRKRGKLPTPNQRVVINERICEGCGDCGTKSNCLSVQPVDTEFGRKTRIHQSSCNLDFSCLKSDCPSFLTVTPDIPVKKEFAPLGPDDIPVPPESGLDSVQVRIAGVGGTGVVTVSQPPGNATCTWAPTCSLPRTARPSPPPIPRGPSPSCPPRRYRPGR